MKQTDSHHLAPNRFNSDIKKTTEVTPNEHRWIHTLEQFATNIDEALAAFITAMKTFGGNQPEA